ncbi:cell division protein FtsL [Lacticaseibacillus daqingensis]|uniref:cell division protein FtsL n=1 Tax=Lacticaseibacillus daqingensis TaxID=2486014 RepID=UPI000F77A11A|nr:cell division protein FtsL [Lacticaseibacillus daqingensis]
MNDNTARDLYAAQPAVQPSPQPTPAPQPQPSAAPARRLAFSPLERVMMVLCGLAVVGVAVVYLTGQFQLAGISRTYQDVQRQTTVAKQAVSDAKQTVGELSNASRLNNYAKAHDFTVIEGNIKRVTNK